MFAIDAFRRSRMTACCGHASPASTANRRKLGMEEPPARRKEPSPLRVVALIAAVDILVIGPAWYEYRYQKRSPSAPPSDSRA